MEDIGDLDKCVFDVVRGKALKRATIGTSFKNPVTKLREWSEKYVGWQG
jgi:hypothetical protein